MRTLVKNFLFFILLITASVVAAQIPNPGFETWTTQGFPSYTNPNGWGTVNSATALIGIATVAKATAPADIHSGTAAVKLETFFISFANETAPGFTTTGTINTSNRTVTGGFPWTQRSTHLTGWFKYAPANGDNCLMEVTLWKRNGSVVTTVGEGEFSTTSTVGSYTKFSIEITYLTGDTPDSARINLSSSSTSSPQQGSKLFVDDLAFVDCSGFSVSLSPTDESAQGAGDGAVDATVSGGTPNYAYSWDNSATTEDISGLASGNYCVTVTDDNGCTASACALVSSPSCSSFWVNVTDTDPSVVGGNDGVVYADAMNGTPPYSYSWDTPDTFGLEAGTYCVTVTDAAGCIATGCVDVTDPDCSAFYITSDATDATNGSSNDGTASVTPNDGFAPFQYLWSNSASDSSLTGLAPGQYCVTVTDDIGCTASDCVTVGPDCAGLSVSVTTTDETLNGANDGTAVATVSGGASPFTYAWSNTATTDSIGGLSDGAYCVTVSDANGCTATACDSVAAGSVGIPALADAGIHIFPNPAQHVVTVELSNQETFHLRLFDAKGKMVKEQILSSQSNAVSLRELPSGNYVVELQQTATGKSYSGKLLKE